MHPDHSFHFQAAITALDMLVGVLNESLLRQPDVSFPFFVLSEVGKRFILVENKVGTGKVGQLVEHELVVDHEPAAGGRVTAEDFLGVA